MNTLYNKFSNFLFLKYGCKVYKLPVNIPATCPNRDGLKGTGGCIFCGEEGAGFELLSVKETVQAQLKTNMDYISKKYKAKKFIAYFQNYSNTYMPADQLFSYMNEACVENIVALYISTRPDCVERSHFEAMMQIKATKCVNIVLELGLQTVNEKTLKILNRGHDLNDFINTVKLAKEYNVETCAHYILDIPWDSEEDVVNGAKLLSELGVEQVKGHSLYILKNTKLGDMYQKGDFQPLSMEQYIKRSISFLENLNSSIVVQRLIGRAPEERSLFCSWETSWWKVQEMVEKEMERRGSYQGCKYE